MSLRDDQAMAGSDGEGIIEGYCVVVGRNDSGVIQIAEWAVGIIGHFNLYHFSFQMRRSAPSVA